MTKMWLHYVKNQRKKHSYTSCIVMRFIFAYKKKSKAIHFYEAKLDFYTTTKNLLCRFKRILSVIKFDEEIINQGIFGEI